MKFSQIPGLTEIKKRLTRSVRDGKVAHAQLFQGREGALTLPLALAYTTYLHCTNRGDDACGTCPACSKSLKYIHPDTHFVFPLSNIKGEKDEDQFRADIMKSWRSFLLEQPFGVLSDWTRSYGGEDKMAIISREEGRTIIKNLSLKPFESPFKVMIIWHPEFMHPSAANAILKILEEPPPNTVFILVTNNAERLLPTTLSRTQHVAVPLLTDGDVEKYLETLPDLDVKRRKKVALEAEGNLRLALTLTEDAEDHHSEFLVNWMRACFKKDYGKMIAHAEEFHEFDKLSQHSLFHYTLAIMRETLLVRSGATALLQEGGDEKFIQDFSKVMTVTKIERTNALVTEAGLHLERNGSPKMIFLDLSLRLSRIMGG